MRRYLAMDDSLLNNSLGGQISQKATEGDAWLGASNGESKSKEKISRFPNLVPTAIAASIAFLLGLALMYWGGSDSTETELREDHYAEGFAVVRRLDHVHWEKDESQYAEGDTLGAEKLEIAGGGVEIQFFSGALMVIKGPAEISLKSAWEAVCHKGAVRMRVPPAARGFELHGPETKIVDLGTEFGFVVSEGEGYVEVFDGEISLSHQGDKERIIREGTALKLTSEGPVIPNAVGEVQYPDIEGIGLGAAQELAASFTAWEEYRNALAQDDRLIAYYTFDRESEESLVPNLTKPQSEESDGAVIMAETVDGRWPGKKSALEFRKPGARVRVNLPGEFSAFTFATWVRIDSLDRWYNALFMADGYENGEPHWQIRDDGSMMLSVMVDDRLRPHPKDPNAPPIRHHRLYYSPPMWDQSMSGQWMHLASVFDPENGRVSHYVNGNRISREDIKPTYMVKKLRIGNGEIGNWGQPSRQEPRFAIRNLNGRMDEIAIFDAALQDEEIAKLFENSRIGKR